MRNLLFETVFPFLKKFSSIALNKLEDYRRGRYRYAIRQFDKLARYLQWDCCARSFDFEALARATCCYCLSKPLNFGLDLPWKADFSLVCRECGSRQGAYEHLGKRYQMVVIRAPGPTRLRLAHHIILRLHLPKQIYRHTNLRSERSCGGEPRHDGQFNVLFLVFVRFFSLLVHRLKRPRRCQYGHVTAEGSEPFSGAGTLSPAVEVACPARVAPGYEQDKEEYWQRYQRPPSLYEFPHLNDPRQNVRNLCRSAIDRQRVAA